MKLSAPVTRICAAAVLFGIISIVILPACGGKEKTETGAPQVLTPGPLTGGQESSGQEYTLRGGPAPVGGVAEGERYRLAPAGK